VPGETPSRYLARLRVEAAAAALRNGALPLAEVAALVGYSSDQALARAFKRHLGIGPGTYRRRLAPDRPRLHPNPTRPSSEEPCLAGEDAATPVG